MHIYQRKLNSDHIYMLIVTLIALIFIGLYIHEAYCKKEMAKSYERELEVQENTYQDLQKEYKKVNDRLKIITDEYNELYESGQ